jgi:uncharacterized protein (TIGR03545 family)
MSEKELNTETQSEDKTPPGMFRVSGLATFVILTAGVGAAGYFGTGPLLKSVLQSQLSQSIGAETNIEAVNVAWSSMGVEIVGFQQADPDQLSQNLVEFKRAAAKVDLFELLIGNVIVDDAAIEGLAFSTQRSEKAAVVEVEESEEPELEEEEVIADDGGMSVPSVDDVLAKADLQTEAKAEQLKAVWKAEKAASEAAFKKLPTDDSLKSYEARWKEIENAKIKSLDDLKVLRDKIKSLKSDINNDKKALTAAKKQLKTSRAAIDVAYDELKAAPKQDWKNIKAQLPIDDPNAVAISKLLFGSEIAGYVEQAEWVYDKAKPFLAAKSDKEKDPEPTQLSGKNIDFELAEQWPSWMVKNLTVDILSPSGLSFTATGKAITSESYVRDEPSEYVVKLNTTNSNRKFELVGNYYVDIESNVTAQGDWQASGLPIADKSLSNSKDLKLTMKSAEFSGKGAYATNNAVIDNQNSLNFAKVKMAGNASTELAKLTLSTLESVESFSLDIGLDGKMTKPDISIKSDLDNQLNSAVKKQVSERWQALESKTKDRLEQKVVSAISSNDGDLKRWNELKEKTDGLEASLKQYAQEKLDKFVSDKKSAYEEKLKKEAEDKLKEKAKEKLKDKLKDFKCCD